MIATRSTGFDHIDLEHCRQRGIVVSNVPSYGDRTVAEHVFALLLGISRNLVEAVNRTRRDDFSQQGLQGFDLFGKTIGVVGTGKIGSCVVEIARGFGMNVLAFDVKPNAALAERVGFQYVPMDELLSRSDIVTLHVPLNRHTHHLIGDEAFGKMKRGVVVINTARGSVIDIQALMSALATGKVRAVGLDVLPNEPAITEEAQLLKLGGRERRELENLLAGHILLHQRNALISPHSAFNTREAVGRLLATTVENIQAFLNGDPQNVVT